MINLEFDVSLSADGNVEARVGIILVLLQEVVAANQNFSQPLQDLCVVEEVVLDELL
jgi:hypothetical protein